MHRIIKKYGDNDIVIEDEETNSYYLSSDDCMFLDIIILSDNIERKEVLDKSIIGFFDVINKRTKEDKTEIRDIKELRLLKEETSFIKQFDEERKGWFDDNIKILYNHTRTYEISIDACDINMIIFFRDSIHQSEKMFLYTTTRY